ncbi:hypothetical protein SRDD_30230 [Serratia sp. DD3]|nr:hypothetical protein SRDD_30230 [Serratia sp. DD3]
MNLAKADSLIILLIDNNTRILITTFDPRVCWVLFTPMTITPITGVFKAPGKGRVVIGGTDSATAHPVDGRKSQRGEFSFSNSGQIQVAIARADHGSGEGQELLKIIDKIFVHLITANTCRRADSRYPVTGTVLQANTLSHLFQNTLQQTAPTRMYHCNGLAIFTAEDHRQAISG